MNKFVVLVVEDDKLILNLMTTTLGIHNYKYLTAASASDALGPDPQDPHLVLCSDHRHQRAERRH